MPKLVISPMAGVTDAPFRFMALKHGADYGISEMLTSQTELWHHQKSQQRLKNLINEPKRILQIAGADPHVITKAVIAAKEFNLDAIEINMGCPAKKVCNVLAGSALLRDEKLVGSILTAAVQATNTPIYLKTRLGWDHENKNIVRISYLAQECGIQLLTIHGRTRSDMYNGAAEFDLIAEVKQNIQIPVFANGDITTPECAAKVLNQTKVDGLYIGRGALGKPWLFRQIKSYLTTGSYEEQNDHAKLKQIILEHILLIHQHYGEYLGVRIARKHIKWYLNQNTEFFLNKKSSFAEFGMLENMQHQKDYLTEWFSNF